MIPRAYITEWRSDAPWASDAQVEQDLVISRAIVEIFKVPSLQKALAFRGGTSLYKLYLKPAARYSEDIDLVQIRAEPIGENLDLIRSVLDPWLGQPRRQRTEGRVNLVYRFDSEDQPPLRLKLKIEINSREHFTELGYRSVPFQVDNRWFRGTAEVTTFAIEELLGTKLRALYQRRKGRDLFDLWHAITRHEVDAGIIGVCFLRYMNQTGQTITRAQFEHNLSDKRQQPDFSADVRPLLRPDVRWDFDAAVKTVLETLIARLPGEGWKRGEP